MGEVYEMIVRETITPKKVRKEIVGTLIRCKKCKWWSGEEYRECTNPNWSWADTEHFTTPPGFYCGWADRKEKWNN